MARGDILERGDIYFAYRPRVEQSAAGGIEDVQRFFMILSPHGRKRYRLIVIGRKRLPEIGVQHERSWGFVQKVGRRPEDVENELEAFDYSTMDTAEIFRSLHIESSTHPLEPLFRGKWISWP